MNFTLIRGVSVHAPTPQGKNDLLLGAGRIIAVGPRIEPPSWMDVQVVHAEGLLAVPGLIDLHVHLIGGGGEMGPSSRCPEATLATLTTAGITTVVGVMGTDSETRHLSSLLAKVRALETEGITAYMYTGAYYVPSPTLTGSVQRDLVLIDKVVGVKLAVSDHRSSQPTFEEISRVAAEARVGGMLGGKPGIVHVHVGGGKRGLGPLRDLVERTEIPISQLLPTHLLRDKTLFDQAMEWVSLGGFVDFTTSSAPRTDGLSPRRALKLMGDAGLDLSHVTWSTDAQGSLPRFDPSTGKATGLLVGSPGSLLEEVRRAVLDEGISLADALAPVTTNPAARLGLEATKGRVAPGYDADLLLLDGETLALNSVWARGERMVADGRPLQIGLFDRSE